VPCQDNILCRSDPRILAGVRPVQRNLPDPDARLSSTSSALLCVSCSLAVACSYDGMDCPSTRSFCPYPCTVYLLQCLGCVVPSSSTGRGIQVHPRGSRSPCSMHGRCSVFFMLPWYDCKTRLITHACFRKNQRCGKDCGMTQCSRGVGLARVIYAMRSHLVTDSGIIDD
jgi:hypothetical protein